MTAAQLVTALLTPDVPLRTGRPCPVCGKARYGMPLTCTTPACLSADVAAEARADRMTES